MKRLKKILSTWLLVLTAFNILNQSIDPDYSFRADFAYYSSASLDDIDTITEFLFEKLCGNDQLFADEDDDSGYPVFAGQEKVDVYPFQLPADSKKIIYPRLKEQLSLLHHNTHSVSVLKGYLNIFSPPPDMKCGLSIV